MSTIAVAIGRTKQATRAQTGEFVSTRRPKVDLADAEERAILSIDFRLLSGFRVSVAGKELGSSVWKQRHPRQLLQILLLQPCFQLARDHVLDLLWPSSDTVDAVNRLHNTVYLLRRIFVSAGAPALQPVVLVQAGMVMLNPAYCVTVDSQKFKELLRVARTAPDSDRILEALNAAVHLYETELFGNTPYEEWFAQPRDEYKRDFCWALEHLASMYRERSDFSQSIAFYQKLLSIDPANESAHQTLMELFDTSGRPEKALMQYSTCKRILKQELDVEPSLTTRTLLTQILGRSKRHDVSNVADADPPAEKPKLYAAPSYRIGLLGREQDVAVLSKWLVKERARLVTVVGGAGIGKTRIAQTLAEQCQGHFDHGAVFVPLTALTDVSQLAEHIAVELGMDTSGAFSLRALYRYLQRRHVLLVLDRFEHLLAGVSFISDLLDSAPGLVILVTSQAPLRCLHEHVYELHGLADRGVDDAVLLFRKIASDHGVSFDHPAQLQEIADICVRLQGNPLAIELASSQTQVLPLSQITAGLDKPLELLVNRGRGIPAPHQSLRQAIQWSFNLLPEQGRALFVIFGLFANDFTVEDACEAFGAFYSRDQICAGVRILLDSHLIVRIDHAPQETTLVVGEPRFTLLDGPRDFAREARESLNGAGEIITGYINHLLRKAQNLAMEVEQHGRIRSVAKQHKAYARDFTQALHWAAESVDHTTRLALARYVYSIQFHANGSGSNIAILENILSDTQLESPQGKRLGAQCYYLLARYHSVAGEHDQAQRAIRKARHLARFCVLDSDLPSKIMSLSAYTYINQLSMRPAARVIDVLVKSVNIGSEPVVNLAAYHFLSALYCMSGRYDEALRAGQQALNVAIASARPYSVLNCLMHMLTNTISIGALGRAQDLYEECRDYLKVEFSPVQQLYLQLARVSISIESSNFKQAIEDLVQVQPSLYEPREAITNASVNVLRDFIEIERGNFSSIRPGSGILDWRCAFDINTADLHVQVCAYRMHYFAHRGLIQCAVESIGPLVQWIGKTGNPLWCSWLAEACAHALALCRNYKKSAMLLTYSRWLLDEAGITPSARQERSWSQVQRVFLRGGYLASANQEFPNSWRQVNPRTIVQIKDFVENTIAQNSNVPGRFEGGGSSAVERLSFVE